VGVIFRSRKGPVTPASESGRQGCVARREQILDGALQSARAFRGVGEPNVVQTALPRADRVCLDLSDQGSEIGPRGEPTIDAYRRQAGR
jgi:hypothetical protein